MEYDTRRLGLAEFDSIETHMLSSDAILVTLGAHARKGEMLPASDPHALSRCRTFRGLSKEALTALSDAFESREFAAGSVLLEQGAPPQGLYLIRSGSVDVLDRTTGRLIDCDGAGAVMGEMSLLTGQACSAGVVATRKVTAFVLSPQTYAKLIVRHPELEIALSQLVSDRLGGRSHDALCGKTIGDFELVRCLNRGGMGVVYEAHRCDEKSNLVALKMLRHRFIYDTSMRDRFDQEAQLLATLKHPNVITLQQSFLAYRTHFLVLDLCDGDDLFGLLRTKGPFPLPVVKALLGQIACGLQYAHAQGVVHRDLKPGNVLVDRSGRVRLTDFGLSRLLEADGVELNAVGTPTYMPPEQFSSTDAVCESDWYALGCLAYQLVTRRSLFIGRDWFSLYERKLQAKPSATWPPLKTDTDLADMIRGAIEPQVDDRRLDLAAVSRWARDVPELFA